MSKHIWTFTNNSQTKCMVKGKKAKKLKQKKKKQSEWFCNKLLCDFAEGTINPRVGVFLGSFEGLVRFVLGCSSSQVQRLPGVLAPSPCRHSQPQRQQQKQKHSSLPHFYNSIFFGLQRMWKTQLRFEKINKHGCMGPWDLRTSYYTPMSMRCLYICATDCTTFASSSVVKNRRDVWASDWFLNVAPFGSTWQLFRPL